MSSSLPNQEITISPKEYLTGWAVSSSVLYGLSTFLDPYLEREPLTCTPDFLPGGERRGCDLDCDPLLYPAMDVLTINSTQI